MYTIEKNKIEFILEFTILWNLFEKDFFVTDFKTYKINDFIVVYWNRVTVDLFDFFQERYLDNWEINSKFENLRFKENQINDIKTNLINSENKLFTIIHILNRFRNNLFHWEKPVQSLYELEDIFVKSNNFLKEVLILKEIEVNFI